MENSNAIRANIRGIKQDIWADAMDASDEVKLSIRRNTPAHQTIGNTLSDKTEA